MNSICITGAVQTDLQFVSEALQQAGMQAPKPADHGGLIDMAAWHEQAMEAATRKPGEHRPIVSIGKHLEQRASDIFVANSTSAMWGWADPRSTWLLDFWLQFDPRLRFILVCTSPRQMIANAIMAGAETVDVDALMKAWLAHHQEMLRIHKQHPQRCLLVDRHECGKHWHALVRQCAEHWSHPLELKDAPAATGQEPDALALYLAQQLHKDNLQAVTLQRQIAARLTRLEIPDPGPAPTGLRKLANKLTHLGNAEEVTNPTEFLAEKVIASYRILKDRSAELQMSQAAREELAALKLRFDKAEASHAQKQKDAESKLKETIQENELLLLQLHQVQEELEETFLKQESALKLNGDLKTQVATLTKARDEQTKLATERQKQIDALTKTNTDLSKEKTTLTARLDVLENAVATLTKARDEQAKLAAERQTKADALTKELDTHAKQAAEHQTLIEALTKTNAALSGEKATLSDRRDALEKEVAAITKARDEQAKLATERQTKIDTLTKERDTHAKQAAERQTHNDVLTKSNAALSGEMTTLTARRDVLEKEVAAITKARDEQAKLATERQTKIDTLTKERDTQVKQATDSKMQIDALTKNNTTLSGEKTTLAARRDALEKETAALKPLTSKLKDAEQENELLLMQLHQVQEELEHYFLQHQETQKQLKTADERWQRMQMRNPDYFDYDSIELLPVEGSQANETTWRIKNLTTVGRNLPELEFRTVVEQDIAGFIFTRQSGTAGPLSRWPANAKNELLIIPFGTRANIQQRAENLFDLATSDWVLLQTLSRVLTNSLTTPAKLKPPVGFKPEALSKALGKLESVIERFPPTLRYDRASLKREQINPDYEHLWLRIENLAFGGKRWPEFEFRLSCANLRPNQFGTHPKLEFPEETSQAPFEAWFVESYDDFGAKLELRFILPEAMDMAIWQRLVENDKAFLAALTKRLPAILNTLRHSGVTLRRNWDDWLRVALAIQRLIVLRTFVRPLASSRPVTNDAKSQAPDSAAQPMRPQNRALPDKKRVRVPKMSNTPELAKKPKTSSLTKSSARTQSAKSTEPVDTRKHAKSIADSPRPTKRVAVRKSKLQAHDKKVSKGKTV
ncbi:MAG: hypothetical protein WC091_13270 [Sulfuricellaceae bacterium]